jgi:hypothetical protein
MMSLKNRMVPTNQASVDLGLGDLLQDQAKAQIDERKKKALQVAQAPAGVEQGQGVFNPMGISAAAVALGLGAR